MTKFVATKDCNSALELVCKGWGSRTEKSESKWLAPGLHIHKVTIEKIKSTRS